MHLKQNILKPNLSNIGSPFNYVSFGVFCVQIGQLFEPPSGRQYLRNFVFDISFASKTSKYRFWLTKWEIKGTKRTIYQVLLKNIFFDMTCRPSNIRSLLYSLHTYEWGRDSFYFASFCIRSSKRLPWTLSLIGLESLVTARFCAEHWYRPWSNLEADSMTKLPLSSIFTLQIEKEGIIKRKVHFH